MFCNDTDLLLLEPAVFTLAETPSFRRLADVSATLAGTALTLDAGSLTEAGVSPGMVATLRAADQALLGHAEVVSVEEARRATVSVPRARQDESPVAPTAQGALRVTVTSFLAQIAAVSAELMRLLGTVERDQAAPAGAGLRTAAVFGTLAAIYRMAGGTADGSLTAKASCYQQAYAALRQAVTARVDLDGDGVAETQRLAGVRGIWRV